MKIKSEIIFRRKSHDRCVCVKLHDDCEHVVIGVVSGFTLPRHGDGDLVIAPGHVVLTVGAGAGELELGYLVQEVEWVAPSVLSQSDESI